MVKSIAVAYLHSAAAARETARPCSSMFDLLCIRICRARGFPPAFGHWWLEGKRRPGKARIMSEVLIANWSSVDRKMWRSQKGMAELV